jgi:polysaccharide biosynthesis transport protein
MNQETQNPFLEQEIDLREYARVLWERRWMIISFTLILCTLSLIRSFMMKPVYEAGTRILIQSEAPNVVNMQEVTPMDFGDREYYQTQYKILKSRSIAGRVDKALGEYVPWSEWNGRGKKNDQELLTGQDRIDALLERVEVKPIPNTQLVEIAAQDIDPKLAAKIANLWAEDYISYVLDTKFDATQYASGWLQEKITEAKSNLESSERKLQDYRKTSKITISYEDGDRDKMLDILFKKKSDLEIALSEKSEYLRPQHPEIIGIKNEINTVDDKIAIEKDKGLNVRDKEIEYSMLKRDVETNKHMYESLLKRIKETEVTGELKTTNIRVIDNAIVPKSPVKPKKKLNFLIALFVGLMGGGGLAFLFEGLDQSVRTPEDVKNHIKLPALASIAMPKDDDKGEDPEFITRNKPRSTISESYRSLRTSIMFTAVEHKRKILAITSSGPQEGKTTSAINLAIVMAQSGEKTILVDADLRKPRIEKAFNFKKEHGLTEVLAGKERLDKSIHKTDIKDLDVIACGTIPPNPSELLGSSKMDWLLKELAGQYDRVIMDTPPVLAVTDAVVLCGKVDGMIIVVRAGETNRNALLKTKEILESAHASNLIGVILNMVETGKGGGHYYYTQYYGKYGKYYSQDS